MVTLAPIKNDGCWSSLNAGDDPPRTLGANIRWREALEDRMERIEWVRKGVWLRCSKDLCYFVDALGWTYQAKPRPATVPMILYPLQMRYMKLLQRDGGRRHFHLDKSRDMGLTWCTLFWMFWAWLFIPGAKFHLASWKEWLVDQRGHPGTHFAKLDFMLAGLPDCVRPEVRERYERRRNILLHPSNGSVITGESTSTRMGHQDRNMAALLDEFALMGQTPRDGYTILGGIRPTTDCMILQSTPHGVGNAFADYKAKAHHSLSFWWPDHPVKGKGLSGPGLAMKPASGFWSDNVDGLRDKLTSPWLEAQKKEAVNAQEIASEVQIDYCASGFQFFPEQTLKRALIDDCMPPFHEGDLVLDPDSGSCKGFAEREGGPLKLWCHPSRVTGFPSSREFDYVVGCDVAQGSRDSTGRGHSNSCAVVLNKNNGEVVAELTVHGVLCCDFAVMVVALCNFFHRAKLIWEGNGPGQTFGHVVTDSLCYEPIYYRVKDKSISNQETLEPGFWMMPGNKGWLFTALAEALDKGLFVERNKQAVAEMRMYEKTATGVVHAIAASTSDPNEARDNHADRVVARVMAYYEMVKGGYSPLSREANRQPVILPNSVAAMREYCRPMGDLALSY